MSSGALWSSVILSNARSFGQHFLDRGQSLGGEAGDEDLLTPGRFDVDQRGNAERERVRTIGQRWQRVMIVRADMVAVTRLDDVVDE